MIHERDTIDKPRSLPPPTTGRCAPHRSAVRRATSPRSNGSAETLKVAMTFLLAAIVTANCAGVAGQAGEGSTPTDSSAVVIPDGQAPVPFPPSEYGFDHADDVFWGIEPGEHVFISNLPPSKDEAYANAPEVLSFYRSEMPTFGWTLHEETEFVTLQDNPLFPSDATTAHQVWLMAGQDVEIYVLTWSRWHEPPDWRVEVQVSRGQLPDASPAPEAS
jgi:hypothetical protein